MTDGTYAPQSPDLSTFFSTSGSVSGASGSINSSATRQNQNVVGSYAPKSPVLPDSFTSYAPPPQQSQQPSFNQFSPTSVNLVPAAAAAPHLSQQHVQQHSWDPSFHAGNQQYIPPVHNHSHSHSHSFQQHQSPTPTSAYQPPLPPQGQVLVHGQAYPAQNYPHPDFYAPGNGSSGLSQPDPHSFSDHHHQFPQDFAAANMPGRPRGSRGVKLEQDSLDLNGGAASAAGAGPYAQQGLGPGQGVEVKTKFPVARIKRIMQADEEVGKVAQVTPVAVSKALELFMISLVLKSSTVAKAKGSKRITAHHLKSAIEADEQFDFLNDIVSKVADAPEAKKERVKSDDDSDEAPAKKKGRGGRRRKGDE